MIGNRRGSWKSKGGHWLHACPSWVKTQRNRRTRSKNNQLVKMRNEDRIERDRTTDAWDYW